MSKIISIILITLAVIGAFLLGFLVMKNRIQEDLGATSNTREWVYNNSSKLVRSLSNTQGTLVSNNGSTATTSPVAFEVIGSTLLDNATSTNLAVAGLTSGRCVETGTDGHLVSASGSCGGSATGDSGAWAAVWADTLAPTNTSAGIFVYASSTFNSTLRVNGNVTLPGLTASRCVETDGNNVLVSAAAACGTGSGAAAAWQQVATDVIQPTNTAASILVNAPSSTITTLRVPNGLNASTTAFDTLIFDGQTFDSLTDDATLDNNSGDLRVVDVTCTDCLNATEIEDIYLLIAGDTATGLMILPDLRASVLNSSSTLIGTLTSTQATTTNLAILGANAAGCDLKATTDGVVYCGTDADSGGAGASNWRELFTNALSPTNTSAGIFINASSTFDSTLRINGQVQAGAGSAAAPAYSFTGDPDSGIYNTADAVLISAGNSAVGTFNSSGLTLGGSGILTGAVISFDTSGSPTSPNIRRSTDANTGIYLDATDVVKLSANGDTVALFGAGTTTIKTLRVPDSFNATTSLIDTLFVGNSTSSATTTARGLKVENLISCDTVNTTAEGHFICGSDAVGAGGGESGAWYAYSANVLAPTNTAAAILVNAASSTITGLVVSDSLSGAGHTAAWNTLHNATTTYPGFQTQFNTALNATTTLDLTTLQVGTLNLSGGSITNYFDTACTGNDFLQDIADNGAFTCTTATGGSADGQTWGELYANVITPTNTSAGIFVNASSTFNSTLRVNDAATNTRSLWIGAGGTANNLDMSADLYVQDDIESDGRIFSGGISIGTTDQTHKLNVDSGDVTFYDNTLTVGGIQAESDASYNLGAVGAAWAAVHLSADAFLAFNNDITITDDNANDQLDFANAASYTFDNDIFANGGFVSSASSTIIGNLTHQGNASTTGYLIVGGTPAGFNLGNGDLLVGRNATTTASLTVGSLTAADCDVKAVESLGLLYCGTDVSGGGGGAAWQAIATNVLQPTNTAASIYVDAPSSTISTLRVYTLNASTTLIDTLTLTNDLTVANGGTGASSLTDHGVLVGSGTDAITALSVGTNGQILVGSTGADPVFATLNCADNLTCTTGAGTLEIDVDDSFLLIAGDTATGLMILPDLRAAVLNSTSSVIDTLVVGTSLSGAGVTAAINSVLNATTTLDLTTLQVGTLNLSGGSITNYFGSACSGNSWLQDIGDNGAFTCGAFVPTAGAWQTYATNIIIPTNTSAAILVQGASSTIANNFNVGGNATTTGLFTIGSNSNAFHFSSTAGLEFIGSAKPYRSLQLTGGSCVATLDDSGAATTTITTTKFTTNHQTIDLADFPDSTDNSCQWSITMPDNYDGGTLSAVLYTTGTTTAGNVAWRIRAISYADSDAIDGTWGSFATWGAQTVATANDIVVSTSTTLTIGGTPAAGETVIFQIERDTSEDSRANYGRFWMAKLEYQIKTLSE